ncbi:MAG: hypothetical protein STSR0009_26240 [Methanoregula sp.]
MYVESKRAGIGPNVPHDFYSDVKPPGPISHIPCRRESVPFTHYPADDDAFGVEGEILAKMANIW